MVSRVQGFKKVMQVKKENYKEIITTNSKKVKKVKSSLTASHIHDY